VPLLFGGNVNVELDSSFLLFLFLSAVKHLQEAYCAYNVVFIADP